MINTLFRIYWQVEGHGLFSSMQQNAVRKCFEYGFNHAYDAQDRIINSHDKLIKQINEAAISGFPSQAVVVTIKKLIHDFNE